MGSFRTNYRVEVTPLDDRFLPQEKYQIERAEALKKQIQRHIDHHSAEVVHDTLCEFCGDPWTEKNNAYNGGCCDKDEANNPSPETAQ